MKFQSLKQRTNIFNKITKEKDPNNIALSVDGFEGMPNLKKSESDEIFFQNDSIHQSKKA